MHPAGQESAAGWLRCPGRHTEAGHREGKRAWKPPLRRLGWKPAAVPEAHHLGSPGHRSGGGTINRVARMPRHKGPLRTPKAWSRRLPDITGATDQALASGGTKWTRLGGGLKIHRCGWHLVVPTGLFPVKTGIYMSNNFKGLDRRPLTL